ncbi:hypothetical protein SSP24_78720 [Streptomyces spinoverrucosus]|uniref:Uncharacterized protein n=1 Tax=Streptomyces spinoverrucosus TaxID=284043 RepID=A0A4Y3VTQ3_9ACTN|nr:hypothetical protein SSP24_78720 [Streptomyces spinoverrucosus]GHB98203.1 hypothetical protein GCM10010397_83300 [Streptomyces spinoverrucosus]
MHTDRHLPGAGLQILHLADPPHLRREARRLVPSGRAWRSFPSGREKVWQSPHYSLPGRMIRIDDIEVVRVRDLDVLHLIATFQGGGDVRVALGGWNPLSASPWTTS